MHQNQCFLLKKNVKLEWRWCEVKEHPWTFWGGSPEVLCTILRSYMNIMIYCMNKTGKRHMIKVHNLIILLMSCYSLLLHCNKITSFSRFPLLPMSWSKKLWYTKRYSKWIALLELTHKKWEFFCYLYSFRKMSPLQHTAILQVRTSQHLYHCLQTLNSPVFIHS